MIFFGNSTGDRLYAVLEPQISALVVVTITNVVRAGFFYAGGGGIIDRNRCGW